MISQQFPVISVKGKPFECGRQHGSQAREQIRKNVDLYFDLWQQLWGAKRPEVLEQCKGFIPVIGEYDADILEELEGIAKGADLSLEEVIALNTRYELSKVQNLASQPVNEGCTSMVALPQVTKDGHTILGQNWDYKVRFYETSIILEVEQETKPNLVTHTEAGVICHRGMNSAGMGVCLNGLVSNLDRFEPRTPILIMMRGILNANSFDQALKAVLGTEATASGNFLIAHRDGEAIDLEILPDDVDCLYPDRGILTHSNHFLGFTNRKDWWYSIKSASPSSLFRFHRARQLLELDDHIDVGSFQRVFKDHFSYPNSICHHVDVHREEPRQTATLASAIMDLTERAFYITKGSPCQNEYYKLQPHARMLE
ncbi:MAG: hypothetical protein E3J66_06440 [Dehalococcoidia bacterium]|nr:MAG: hypothetical protein E3J66_06440 [Dehalococcoidia bacterium]